jgi:hypothetical protein
MKATINAKIKFRELPAFAPSCSRNTCKYFDVGQDELPFMLRSRPSGG